MERGQVLQDRERRIFAQGTCFIMQILLGCFLFSVLLRTGGAFQCITCNEKGVTTCTTPLRNCNPGDTTCLKSLSEFIKGETETMVEMGCAPQSFCMNHFIDLSYAKEVYIRRQYSCCETDGCTPRSIKLPPLNKTTNGKACPVCSLETGHCSDDAPLECTGFATHCFAAILTDGGNKPVKGCTTESVCNTLKTYEVPLIENSRMQNVTCQEAKTVSVSVPSGLGDGRCSSLDVFLLVVLPLTLFLFSGD